MVKSEQFLLPTLALTKGAGTAEERGSTELPTPIRVHLPPSSIGDTPDSCMLSSKSQKSLAVLYIMQYRVNVRMVMMKRDWFVK